MKINKTNVMNFSELFYEAEKRLGWSWNKCCDIFHRKEIICSPENPNFKNVSTDDREYYKDLADKGDEIGMAYKLIQDILEENNIDEITILTD